MFIVLTDCEGLKTRVRVDSIIWYYGSEHGTYVGMSGQSCVEVKETPEQIDTILREQYITVFERTHNE